MRKIDLDKYTTVDDRISLFYADYPNGGIKTKITHMTDDYVVFKASLFRDYESDSEWTTGFAQEFRDKELKTNKYGDSYESVNYTSHLENCETSAIGRALANAGYTGKGGRPSREEMEKVKRMKEKPVLKQESKVETDDDFPFEPDDVPNVETVLDSVAADAIADKINSFKTKSDLDSFVLWFNDELNKRSGKDRKSFQEKYQTMATQKMSELSR